ncbi:hypothetical protein [Luedemannella helvata]|uniref:Uncharacterized protein n=1 Tax=Luedemannella helvata TaxID=349315 RepID=A0ABP4X4W1_9ACTN
METGQWGAGSWAEDGRVPDPAANAYPPRPASIYPPEAGSGAFPQQAGPYPAEPSAYPDAYPDPRAPVSPFPDPPPADPRTANPRVGGPYPANAYPYSAESTGPQPRPGVPEPRSGAWLNSYPGDRSGAWSTDSGARRVDREQSGSWRSGGYPGDVEDLSLAEPEPPAGRGRWARTYGRPRPEKGGGPKVNGHPPRAGDGYPTGLRPVSAAPVYRGSFPMRRINSPATPVAEQLDYRRAAIFTAAWYGVPLLLYLAWALTLEANRRTFVLHQLGGNSLWLLSAALLSLLLGLALRWVAHEWRNLTVSFAASVMGAGIVTVVHTLATGS